MFGETFSISHPLEIPNVSADAYNNSVVYANTKISKPTTSTQLRTAPKNQSREIPKVIEMQFNLNGRQSKMSPILNKLLYEMHSIFCKAQMVALASHGTLKLDDTIILSQRYRMAIRNAIKESAQSPKFRLELNDELISVDIIWALFEAVTLRPKNNSIVVDLIEWGQECFSFAEDFRMKLTEEISQMDPDEKPERHQLFWTAIFHQLLSTDFKSALLLLKYHSMYEKDVSYQKVGAILQRMDSILSHNFNAEAFIMVQRDIRELLRNVHFNKHNDLLFMCSILSGENTAFEKCSTTFSISWYEILPAYVLFSYPGAKISTIGSIAEKFFDIVESPKTDLALLDKTLFSILSLNCLNALKLIRNGLTQSLWFSTHLIDLLHLHDSSVLSAQQQRPLAGDAQSLGGLNMRSEVLVVYSNWLFSDSNKGMWEIAADYLMNSGHENAKEMLEERTAAFDWEENTQLAERILSLCDKYDLLNAKNDLTRAITLKFLREKEWSTSLSWALRNGSAELIGIVSQKVLCEAKPDRIVQMRIFDAMSDKFLVTRELILLYKFYTMKRHQFRGELREAVNILHELFVDNISPEEFHVVLFDEMLKLLSTCTPYGLLGGGRSNPKNIIPTLDKVAVQDMFRALGMFEQYQKIRLGKQKESSEIQEKIKGQLQVLRPMLINLLGTSCLF